MDRTEWGHIAGMLMSALPSAPMPAATVEVYYRALSDLEAPIVEAAVLKVLQSHVYSNLLPTFGAIREAAAAIATGSLMAQPALEAWGAVKQAVAYFGREGWARAEETLDQNAARAIRALGWSDFCNSDMDDEATWRARFVELYNEYCRRERENVAMLPQVKQMTAAQLETRQALRELTRKLTAPTVK